MTLNLAGGPEVSTKQNLLALFYPDISTNQDKISDGLEAIRAECSGTTSTMEKNHETWEIAVVLLTASENFGTHLDV